MRCFDYFTSVIFPLKGDFIPIWENSNLEKFQYGFLPVLGMDPKIQETSEQLVSGGTHKIFWFGLVKRAPQNPPSPGGAHVSFSLALGDGVCTEEILQLPRISCRIRSGYLSTSLCPGCAKHKLLFILFFID
jgi:hypothetical protein